MGIMGGYVRSPVGIGKLAMRFRWQLSLSLPNSFEWVHVQSEDNRELYCEGTNLYCGLW